QYSGRMVHSTAADSHKAGSKQGQAATSGYVGVHQEWKGSMAEHDRLAISASGSSSAGRASPSHTTAARSVTVREHPSIQQRNEQAATRAQRHGIGFQSNDSSMSSNRNT